MVGSLSLWQQAGLLGGGGGAPEPDFDPVSLFGASEQGFIFDFSDQTTAFQERTGASATTPSGVDGAIGTLRDKSPNAHYFTAAADTNRPTLRQTSSFWNAQFDGTDDYLFEATAYLYAGGAVSVFAAVNAAAQTAANRVVCEGHTVDADPIYSPIGGSTTTTSNFSTFYRNDANTVILDHSVNQGVAFNSAPHVVGITDNGSSVTPYLDGVAGSARAYTRSATTLNRIALGALLRSTAGSFYNGRLYAIVAISRVLSSLERDNLVAWLGAKAGLSLALLWGVNPMSWGDQIMTWVA